MELGFSVELSGALHNAIQQNSAKVCLRKTCASDLVAKAGLTDRHQVSALVGLPTFSLSGRTHVKILNDKKE